MSSSSSRVAVSGMAAARGRAAAGQRDVDPLARAGARRGARDSRRRARLVEPRLELVLERVQLLARLAARLRGQRAQRLQQRGDRPRLAAEEAVAHAPAGRRRRRRRASARLEVRAQRADLLLQVVERARPSRRSASAGRAAGSRACAPSALGAALRRRRGRALADSTRRAERLRVARRDVGQRLAVEVDARALQARR